MLESVKSCPICKKHVYIYICEYSVWFWVDSVMPLYLPWSLRNGPGLYWYCWVFWKVRVSRKINLTQANVTSKHDTKLCCKRSPAGRARGVGGRHTVSWCSLSPSCELSKSEMPVAPSAMFWKKMLSYWMQDVKTYKSQNHVFSCSVTPLKRSVLINQPVLGEVRFMSVTWHRVYCAASTHAPSKKRKKGFTIERANQQGIKYHRQVH